MSQSIKQRTSSLKIGSDAATLRKLFEAALVDMAAVRAEVAKLVTDVTALITREKNYTITSPTLGIASGKKTATIGTGFIYLANGTLAYKAAADCSALVGTIALSKSGAWAFFIDAAGTVTTSSKTADCDTEALAIAAALAIAIPANKSLIGYLIVTNSAGGNFVGGTTDLDAATATDLYINITGPGVAPTAITAATPAALTIIA